MYNIYIAGKYVCARRYREFALVHAEVKFDSLIHVLTSFDVVMEYLSQMHFLLAEHDCITEISFFNCKVFSQINLSNKFKTCNNIPINIRELPTLNRFKNQLKSYAKSYSKQT